MSPAPKDKETLLAMKPEDQAARARSRCRARPARLTGARVVHSAVDDKPKRSRALRYDLPAPLLHVRVLYWQDIPSLIRVTAEDGTQLSRQLPDRFQQEIDRVAMAEGLIGSDAYLEQWEWRDAPPRQGSLDEVLDAVEAELTKR